MGKRESINLVATVFIVIAIALLLPGLGIAGNLEPSGPPASTMKTLDEIPPTWSQKLQCDTTACPRFVPVFPGPTVCLDGVCSPIYDGVLDKETGLVWEQAPSTSTVANMQFASNYCATLSKGGRKGWRLPTVQELASLVDPSVPAPGPTLPSGYPFSNVNVSGCYWSATPDILSQVTYPLDPLRSSFHGVCFSDGSVESANISSSFWNVWCVRGGVGVDFNPQ